MIQQTQQEMIDWYIKLALETANGIQKKVFESNGMLLIPQLATDLRPVPVYEPETTCNLLTQANIGKKITTIDWPLNQDFAYLPAYYKRIKQQDGKIANKIVVNATNYCEARFFAAKELMHCFIDDDGIAASNSIALVNELIESLVVSWDGIKPVSTQGIVDRVAYIGAMEYLIPATWIPLLTTVKDHIAESYGTEDSFRYVAQLIRVPKNVLRVRLRNSST